MVSGLLAKQSLHILKTAFTKYGSRCIACFAKNAQSTAQASYESMSED